MNPLEIDAPTNHLDEVIAEYLETARLGTAPTPEELLARHADLVDDLGSFLTNKACFEGLARGALMATERESQRAREKP